jgi:multidrug efflux pump
MNISEPFIRRPIATTLLVIAIFAGRRGGIPPAAGVAAAAGGFPHHFGVGRFARRQSRDHGLLGRHPAGASVWPHCGGHRNDLFQQPREHQRHVAIRFEPDINAAARDVQAAINAARGYLPTNLPNNPTYRKVNPADSPIFILSLTSAVLSKSQMYDAASSILAQKLSQISGVGQVIRGGGALPGVRIELNPTALNKYGIGLEQVRGVLSNANANTPKGHFSDGHRMWEVGANDQLFHAVNTHP